MKLGRDCKGSVRLTSADGQLLIVMQWLTTHSAEDHDIGEGLRENFSARGRWNSAITVCHLVFDYSILVQKQIVYHCLDCLCPSAESPGNAELQAGRHRQRRAFDADVIRRRRWLYGHGRLGRVCDGRRGGYGHPPAQEAAGKAVRLG